MEEAKLQLLVCAHKLDENTRNEGPYTAIQVGKALHPDLDFGYLNDNDGDNISDRNPNWCELTSLYWGWKNISNVGYLGLCHYRRYFDADITEQNIEKLISGYDMITVKQDGMVSKRERAKNLMYMTSQEDYYIFADTFLSIHPEYRAEFNKYFYDSRDSYPFQMFISTKKLYDEYCEFLFPVLFEVEKKLKSHGYTRQKRTMGYIGEWCLGLFIYCRDLKVKQLPLMSYGVEKINHPKFHAIKLFVERIIADIQDTVSGNKKYLSVPDAIRVGLIQDNISLTNI